MQRRAFLLSAFALLALPASAQTLGPGPAASALDRQLIAAAWRNDLAEARRLIAAGADVNGQDETRQSAFLIAASEGFPELLRLTLAHGANVHFTDSYNGTALIRAAHHGHVEVIAELLKTGIKVDHVNRLGWTALIEAIVLGDGGARHTETLRLLIEAKANVNIADRSGETPLTLAKRRSFSAMVRMLEAAGGRE
ncbi:MAG: ankyrin repeat domain-containing protein [Alphaproteobacteria bacterium]|nr:ankyrin repeat domain-containing protein [Alphaproteobacteria bacterium]